MKLVRSESDCWHLLETLFRDDPHPGTRFIRDNLALIKEQLERGDGQLISFSERTYPYRFVGAVAVSMKGCGIVRLHFYYLYEEFRRRMLEILPALFSSVHEFGLAFNYGYVFITVPRGDVHRSQHDVFLPCSSGQLSGMTPDGQEIITYSIPKDRFLRFCR